MTAARRLPATAAREADSALTQLRARLAEIDALRSVSDDGKTAQERREVLDRQAAVLILSSAVVLINLLVDLLYGLLDPRIRVRA